MGGGSIPRSSSKVKISEQELEQHRSQHQKKDCRLQKWPDGALQAVQTQLGLLTQDEQGNPPSPKRLKYTVDERDNKKTIEIQQEALPQGWEQFLDLNTGEIYYIDWSTCKRTCRDPREIARIAEGKIRELRQGSEQCQVSSTSSSDSAMFPQEGDFLESSGEDEASSSRQRGYSHDSDEDNVMVALGCHHCLMYFMLPRLDPICPSCGSHLQAKS